MLRENSRKTGKFGKEESKRTKEDTQWGGRLGYGIHIRFFSMATPTNANNWAYQFFSLVPCESLELPLHLYIGVWITYKSPSSSLTKEGQYTLLPECSPSLVHFPFSDPRTVSLRTHCWHLVLFLLPLPFEVLLSCILVYMKITP